MIKKLFLYIFLCVVLLIGSVSAAEIASYNCEDQVEDQTNSYDLTPTSITYSTTVPSFNVSGDGGNKSCSFDGAATLLAQGSSLLNALGTNGTAQTWINFDTISNGKTIMSAGDASATSDFYIVQMFDDGDGFKVKIIYKLAGGTVFDYRSTTNISTSTWYHLVLKTDLASDKMELWINGVNDTLLQTSGTLAADWFDSSSQIDLFTVGALRRTTTGNWMDGLQDEIRYWEEELNSTEIVNLYNCGVVSSCGAPPPSTSQFTVSLSNVNTFNATINGTAYTTTNGTINTIIDNSSGLFVDVNLSAATYFDKDLSVNSSSSINTSLSRWANITASNFVTNNTINGFTVSVDGSTYQPLTHPSLDSGYVFVPAIGLFNTTFFYNGTYISRVVELNLTANNTFNTHLWVSEVTFNFSDLVTGASINNYTLNDSVFTKSTTNGSLLLKLNNGSNSLTVTNSVGYFNKTFNLNINPLDILTSSQVLHNHELNVTPKDFFTNATLSNFTIRINTSNYDEEFTTDSDSMILNLSQNLTYTLFINVSGYASNTSTLTLDNVLYSNYTGYFFKENSVYVRVYDEETNTLINDRNVSVEFIGASLAQENVTSTGALIVEPLIQGAYRIRYSADEYPERLYFVTVTSGDTQAVDVYLLKNTSVTEITATVLDEKSDAVQDSYVKLLRYNLDCNCYITVEVGQTNFEGETGLLVEYNSELYKFIIEYNNITYLETTPFKITSTSLTFYITLESLDPTNILRKFQNLVYSLSYNNATSNFRFTFSDVNNQVSTACLKVYDFKTSSETLVNSTCVNSTAATILIGATPANGTTYKAVASVYYDDEVKHVDTIFKGWSVGKEVLKNNLSVLLVIMLIMAFTFISAWNPSVSVILTGLALIMSSAFGILSLGITALMSVIGVIIIVILQNKS